MPGLLDKRLVFVTGKGGVGRTTVAGALGLLAARRGRRTIVVELLDQERLPRAFTGAADARRDVEIELAPNLWTVSIDPQRAMEDYLADQLPVPGVAELLSSSRVFQYFAFATPGLRELLAIGKVWDLAQDARRTTGTGTFDLVIADLPATGHGLAMLDAPRTFADIARVGPIARQGRTIRDTLADAGRTGVLAVAQPLEAPVTEALHIAAALPRELGHGPDEVIVNGLYPARFGRASIARIDTALNGGEPAGRGPATRAALRAARSERDRLERQRVQLGRLRRGLARPPLTLPFVFRPELGREELTGLSEALEEQLVVA